MTVESERDRDATDEFAELLRMSPETVVPPRRRGGNGRRGLIVTAIVLCVLLAMGGGYVAWALNAPLPAVSLEASAPVPPVTAPAAVPLSPDGSSAISVTGAEAYLGSDASGIWMSSGSADPRSIASVTKLIAALVILDRIPLAPGDPGPTLTFSEADNDLYDKYYLMDATIAPMPTGSSMSLHDAIATMLLPSASNYVEAVTTWVFGSPSAFVSATRDWLNAHAFTSTTIVEPTGISAANTSSTSDLIGIGRIAAANPVIAQIVAQRAIAVNDSLVLYNTNSLVGVEGVDGLKTGNLGEGRFSLLYSADVAIAPGVALDVVGVALDGQTRESVNASVAATLAGLRLGFTEVSLATADQVVGTVTTAWGATAEVVIANNASILVWSDTPITVDMKIVEADAYEDGDRIGTITWTAGPESTDVPLLIQGSIAPPTESWRLTHPTQLWAQ